MWCDDDVHEAAMRSEVAKLNALGSILSGGRFGTVHIKLYRGRYWVEWVPAEKKWFLFS